MIAFDVSRKSEMLRDCVVMMIGLYLNEVAMSIYVGNAKYQYHSNLDGYLSNTNVLYNGMSRSKTECAKSCEGRQPMCTSFFYVKNSRVCKLHGTVFTSITGLTNAFSAKFFERVNCPDGWIYFQESCYLSVNQRHRFDDAQAICGQHSSNLVHIEGLDENNFLKNYFSQFRQKNHWLGMRVDLVEDVWRWVDTNTTLTYTDWYPEEPDGGRFPNCAVLVEKYDYEWVDRSCDDTNRPLCERRSL